MATAMKIFDSIVQAITQESTFPESSIHESGDYWQVESYEDVGPGYESRATIADSVFLYEVKKARN